MRSGPPTAPSPPRRTPPPSASTTSRSWAAPSRTWSPTMTAWHVSRTPSPGRPRPRPTPSTSPTATTPRRATACSTSFGRPRHLRATSRPPRTCCCASSRSTPCSWSTIATRPAPTRASSAASPATTPRSTTARSARTAAWSPRFPGPTRCPWPTRPTASWWRCRCCAPPPLPARSAGCPSTAITSRGSRPWSTPRTGWATRSSSARPAR